MAVGNGFPEQLLLLPGAALPPEIFQPGHPGDDIRIAAGVVDIQILQAGQSLQRCEIINLHQEQFQENQLFQTRQRCQIGHIGVCQDQIFQMGHEGHKIAVGDIHVSQVHGDDVGAVAQIVHVCGPNGVAVFGSHEPGGVRLHPDEGADGHGPDDLDVLVAAVQLIHFLIADAAVGHVQIGKRRQIGKQCLNFIHSGGNAGEIQCSDGAVQGNVPEGEDPGKLQLGPGCLKGLNLCDVRQRTHQPEAGQIGQIRQHGGGLLQAVAGDGGGGGVIGEGFSAEGDVVGQFQMGIAFRKKGKRRIVIAVVGIDPLQLRKIPNGIDILRGQSIQGKLGSLDTVELVLDAYVPENFATGKPAFQLLILCRGQLGAPQVKESQIGLLPVLFQLCHDVGTGGFAGRNNIRRRAARSQHRTGSDCQQGNGKFGSVPLVHGRSLL